MYTEDIRRRLGGKVYFGYFVQLHLCQWWPNIEWAVHSSLSHEVHWSLGYERNEEKRKIVILLQ